MSMKLKKYIYKNRRRRRQFHACALRRHASFVSTDLNICVLGGVTDVINGENFLKIGRGVPELEDPEKWHFPLKAVIALTTVLRYRADCDQNSRHHKAHNSHNRNKKAQLSLTNPRDAKACQNCSNSTCLQRCRWQYWPIFVRLTAIASEIREIPRNSLKIQTYGVQGHPRSSILVSIESPLCDLLLVIDSNFSRICYRFRDIHG